MDIIAVDDKITSLKALVDAIYKAEPKAVVHPFQRSTEALDYIKEAPCEIAFMEIQMPEINGIELAKRMKMENPFINIIFATEYSDYMGEAFAIHASGYLMKPITSDAVRTELDNLRHPVSVSRGKVLFQCFGNFEVYIDGEPIDFKYGKTKEYLAYMVDRRTMCTNDEVVAALWECEVSGSYLRTIRKDMFDTFKKYGCEDIFIKQWGALGIDISRVSCDYLDWLAGMPGAMNQYRGEYMSQYSWAEITHAGIEF